MALKPKVDLVVTDIHIVMMKTMVSMAEELMFVIPQPEGKQWLSCLDLDEVTDQMRQGCSSNDLNGCIIQLFCQGADSSTGPTLVRLHKTDHMFDWYEQLSPCLEGTNLKLVACVMHVPPASIPE
jgi:hypothetical protein